MMLRQLERAFKQWHTIVSRRPFVQTQSIVIASLLFLFRHKFSRPALRPPGCHVGRAIVRLPADGKIVIPSLERLHLHLQQLQRKSSMASCSPRCLVTKEEIPSRK